MRMGSRFAFASGLALAISACGSEPPLPVDQTGNGEDTIELAEFPDRPYWGDTHLHTDNSIDAFGFGVRLGPEAALRFARGEQVTATTGAEAQLARPLDFLVISDHSDALGATRRLYDAPRWYVSWVIGDPTVLRWYDMMHESPEQSTRAIAELITAVSERNVPEAFADPEAAREGTEDIWNTQLGLLDRYKEPGVFTALAGFEWTLMPDGNNLHRVVMFRDGSERTRQTLPFPGIGTTPEQLWDYMAAYENETGGRVLAIPHNGNLSNGLMFALETPDGQPIDQDWVEARARWEPLVEVTQSKGTSEQHPSLAPSDEFANFEIWDKGNLNVVPKKPGMIQYEYAREALKRGLKLEEEFGTNPFKFGMLGSTDDHTGISSAEENNFFGKFPASEPSPERSTGNAFDFDGNTVKDWQLGASGLTAVWAPENTRASIWDAMKRKEVYGTTGSRIFVRFFGGWDFEKDDAERRDPGTVGYGKGVPMGGVLANAKAGVAPGFVVQALKDPQSANLDRIQVVKGWLDAQGQEQEAVYNVAWFGERQPDGSGQLPAVGDTVDRINGRYSNSIGAASLSTYWSDPDFDPAVPAFYYVRVLEIPTPRHTLLDAIALGMDKPKEGASVIQERAYSSPLWYQP